MTSEIGVIAATQTAKRDSRQRIEFLPSSTLLLIADENPKVVSERLGHSTIVLTLDTYSHVLPTMQQRASEKLDKLLASAGRRKEKAVS